MNTINMMIKQEYITAQYELMEKLLCFLESCWNSLNWQIRWRYYNFCVVMQWCNFNLILIKMIKKKLLNGQTPFIHYPTFIFTLQSIFSPEMALSSICSFLFFKIWHTSTCQAVIYLIISIWFFFLSLCRNGMIRHHSTQFHYGHADKENENAYYKRQRRAAVRKAELTRLEKMREV